MLRKHLKLVLWAASHFRASAAPQNASGRGASKSGPLRNLAIVAALLLAPVARGQSAPDAFDTIRPVPVFTASSGFITTFDGGTTHLGPQVTPLLLVPIGQKWLIESRGTIEADLAPPPGGSGFEGDWETNVDYLQLDYFANRYVTVDAGRYLIPFGIYNERLYPIWIRNLQTDPLILPLESGEYGAGTGGMLRGGFNTAPNVEFNYATYFSALSAVEHMESDRLAGGRAGIFLPGPRLEFGGSFQHSLQEEHKNSFGFHFEWQPPAGIDLRAEYARSYEGSGYWVESAYRLNRVPKWQHALSRVQVVARMQQYFAPRSEDDALMPNTNMFEFGVNYYFRDDMRFVSSYGRQFTPTGDQNVWTFGLTARLAMPLGHGEMR